MTSLPMIVAEQPLGIVIQAGARAPRPALFWAYLWADDDEGQGDHWHYHIPTGQTA